jgi:hypothetical protein
MLNIQIFELPSATKPGVKSFKNLKVISPSHWWHVHHLFFIIVIVIHVSLGQ